MAVENIFKNPIIFALEETMKRFENPDNKEDKIIYESLRRSKIMWENVRINYLDIGGMTYEQFCDYVNKKKNIMFLTDDEVEDFNKAVQIMNIMRN